MMDDDEDKSQKKTVKSHPVRDKQDEGGKTQTGSKNARERRRQLFLKNVAKAALNTRDKMDAKSAWKIDMNTENSLRIEPESSDDHLPTTESLTDKAALLKRAQRFSKNNKP